VEKERAKEANGTKTARRLRPTIAAAEVSTTTMEAFMRTTLMRTINNSRFSIAFALPEFAFGRNPTGMQFDRARVAPVDKGEHTPFADGLEQQLPPRS
jgi:hypothetical protein